jgi:hypothetical protein
LADRLLRAHRTLLLVPRIEVNGEPYLLGGTLAAPVIAPMTAPTAAILNTWLAVTDGSKANAGIGGNISAATLDDVDLGLADSDTESELVVTSRGDEQAITLFNVDAKFVFLRDLDPVAAGTFNLARDLVIGPDIEYVIVDRAIGEHSAIDPFVAGQVVSLYDVITDVAPDDSSDKSSIKINQNFVGTGEVAINVAVV